MLLEAVSLTPKVTYYYAKEDEDIQRELFLGNDDIQGVRHHYPLLADSDFSKEIDALKLLRSELETNSLVDPKFLQFYVAFVEENLQKYQMLDLVRRYHETKDEFQKQEIKLEYIDINKSIYGFPDKDNFNSIVADIHSSFGSVELTGRAEHIREELFRMLAKPEVASQRFRPSRGTVEWLNKVVDTLYGEMLKHVPAPTSEELESGLPRMFLPNDIKTIFETIIDEEFGESAAEWGVFFVKSGPIEVDRINKRVNIPENRRPATRNELRGLVVHELGVHFLRGVMGYEMDNPLLALGFTNYRLLEEGVGKAAQQALELEYIDSGDSYYLVASMMQLEGRNMREVFEVMWRYLVLKNLSQGDIDDKKTTLARENAYRCINRMTQGMDDVPSNIDLSYYLGSDMAWKYFEKNIDDVDAITYFFMGRMNTADMNQLRLALDSRQFPHGVQEGRD